MKFLLLVLLSATFCIATHAQTHVFAQLNGTPVNTEGWSLNGSATVGNITGTNNSEVILCRAQTSQSGAIFFNQPINLNICNKWIAEFDFRMFDGTNADGLTFCFLDVPPSGFVVGAGMGIPGSANGLKVCFDSYLNCAATGSAIPKIELRWGVGYDECWNQPTLQNTSGAISFIRSNEYSHAKVVYDNGNIEVYVNNTLYLTGFQQFNFNGYLGFTASTGGQTDNHSIKNVVIYTDMPPSEAGQNQTVCSGKTYQLGTPSTPNYVYTWTPTSNLSARNISNPSFSQVNNTSGPIVSKYYVNTAFSNNAACASKDSVTITVLPATAISISIPSTSICDGSNANFTATLTTAGSSPVLQWKVNNINVGTNSSSLNISTLKNGDVVTCVLTPNDPCSGSSIISNTIVMTVNPLVVPAVNIRASANNVCAETPITFTAIPTNAGNAPAYQWTINGVVVPSNTSTYTSASLNNNDLVQVAVTSGNQCSNPATVSSPPVSMKIIPLVTPEITISPAADSICAGGTATFTATYTNGGTAPVLQWKKNGISVGTNSTSYTDNTLTNGDAISCTITSNITCVTNATAESNSVVMTVIANPVVTLNNDPTLCMGTTRVLDAGDFTNYLWSNGSTERTITVNTTGTYYVRVTNPPACVGSDTIEITTLIPSPANFLPGDSAVCAYSRFMLSAIGNYASYLWSTNSTTAQTEVRQPGIYWLQVTNQYKCVARDSIEFTVKDCGNDIYYPTAFTPNGDGVNELFKPLLLNKVDHYKFSVFNRLGQMVFVTTDVNKGWDGTVNGIKQNAQTFVWMCTYQFDQQPLKTDKGTILLIL